MYLFFEKGMRGVVCYISERSRQIPTNLANYITFWNKNNLYGYDMSKSLPMGGFQRLNPAKFNLDNVV